MTSYDFQTTTYAKWILTGEHAVIRGHAALVFPIKTKQLALYYTRSSTELDAQYCGETGADMHLLFWGVLEQGIHLLGKSLNHLNGHFLLESNLPIGVGLGASAALCMAMSTWFLSQSLIAQNDAYDFAKELENLFHGQSSGLDIAGVRATGGIYFKEGTHSPIEQAWQPKWYLSSCNQIGITSHCIQQVDALWKEDHQKASAIDRQMAESTITAKKALQENHPHSLTLLAKAINMASDCFEQWGLVSEGLQGHIHNLRNAGAIAVKPTGSGSGGYAISLWESDPPESLGLIAI